MSDPAKNFEDLPTRIQVESALNLIGHIGWIPPEYQKLSDLYGKQQAELMKDFGYDTIKKLTLLPKIAAVMVVEEYKKRENLSSPEESREFFRKYMAMNTLVEEKELFACAFMDAKNGLLGVEIHARGEPDHANISVRKIMEDTLAYNATSVLVAHNHPSGYPEPSPEDIRITNAIMAALDTVGVRLNDHLIVAKNDVCSLYEAGIIDTIKQDLSRHKQAVADQVEKTVKIASRELSAKKSGPRP